MQLEQALDLILENSAVTGVERVALESSFGRVCTARNRGRLAVPGYDQSTRDGYAVRGNGEVRSGEERFFIVRGEIQAGPGGFRSIKEGEAYRIMTGGLVPDHTDRVVPQEQCRDADNGLIVNSSDLSIANRFIRFQGSDCKAGAEIVKDGTRLDGVHAGHLASSGNSMVEVYRRPRVAFLCSGSELVIEEGALLPGQKYSSNHYLLKSLIEQHGAVVHDYGLVDDDSAALEAVMRSIIASDADMIISTGGVGPGKYDLFSSLLPGLGVKIAYRSLLIRPGRSTLFGTISGKLYFGLPGPPSAVHILFRELIVPALRKMQGCQVWFNRRVDGILLDDLTLSRAEMSCFREGWYVIEDGHVNVRCTAKNQSPNCFMITEAGVTSYCRGDKIGLSLFGI